ncbi:unnamed protein product [Closterium sp. Yama58-4]|nr:unnamed protein product [Closterium sp. Yama58-4]
MASSFKLQGNFNHFDLEQQRAADPLGERRTRISLSGGRGSSKEQSFNTFFTYKELGGSPSSDQRLGNGARGSAPWERRSRISALGTAHADQRLGNGARGSAPWERRTRISALGTAHADQRLGNGARGSAPWERRTRISALGTAHAGQRLGSGARGLAPECSNDAAGVEGKQAPSIRHPQVLQAKVQMTLLELKGSRPFPSAILKYSKPSESSKEGSDAAGVEVTLLELKGSRPFPSAILKYSKPSESSKEGSDAAGRWKDLNGGATYEDKELLGRLLGGAAATALHGAATFKQRPTKKKTDSAAQWGLPGCLDQEGAELWLRRGQGLMGPWSGKHETDMQQRFPTLGRVWGAEFGYPFQWCCDEQPGRNALEPDGVQTAGRRAVHWREVQASRAFWAPGWPGSITAGMGYNLFKSVSHRGGCGGLEH